MDKYIEIYHWGNIAMEHCGNVVGTLFESCHDLKKTIHFYISPSVFEKRYGNFSVMLWQR